MTLEEQKKRWLDETYAAVVKRYPERCSNFSTSSGIPLPPLLTPQDADPGTRVACKA